MPQRYRLDLAYDGADFHGWQSQPSGHTIQDIVEKALGTFLRHPVKVVGASRTDSGVHAWQQVCSFATDVEFDPDRWLRSLQGLLPPAIGALKLVPVADNFHPIRSANSKIYLYRIWNSSIRHPLARQWSWHVPEQIDQANLNTSLQSFVGEHDFTSFCAVDSTTQTKTRKILAVGVDEVGPTLNIWLHGTGFLKQMVRAIVGTVVEAGLGKRAAGHEAMAAIFAARNRDLAGQTAPASGLTLVSIFYESNPSLAQVRAWPVIGGFPVKFGDDGEAGLTYRPEPV